MPLLGLKLVKTESFAKSLESILSNTADNVGSEHQPMSVSEKLKASNFPIINISVGNWQVYNQFLFDHFNHIINDVDFGIQLVLFFAEGVYARR